MPATPPPPALDRDVELAELLEEVRRIDVLSKRLVTDVLTGGWSSAFRGGGIEFEGVREYVEGDDPRKVDWNVTARLGRPFVKEFVDERELTVLFLLDLSASMTGGFSHWSARQMAARVCACLALAAARNGDKAGLIAFSEDVDRYVPPKKGMGHVLRIVRDCLALPGASVRTDLAPALEFASRVLHRRAVLFVVSDFLADGWARPLALAARRHDVVAVRLAVPELGPPGAGLVRTRDPETGREVLLDWGSARVRDAYRQRVEDWQSETKERIRRAGADVLDVPVPLGHEPAMVARPILRFFRMREARGAKR